MHSAASRRLPAALLAPLLCAACASLPGPSWLPTWLGGPPPPKHPAIVTQPASQLPAPEGLRAAGGAGVGPGRGAGFSGGEERSGGPPSTDLDLTGKAPRVLRLGAIGQADLEPLFARFRSRESADSP